MLVSRRCVVTVNTFYMFLIYIRRPRHWVMLFSVTVYSTWDRHYHCVCNTKFGFAFYCCHMRLNITPGFWWNWRAYDGHRGVTKSEGQGLTRESDSSRFLCREGLHARLTPTHAQINILVTWTRNKSSSLFAVWHAAIRVWYNKQEACVWWLIKVVCILAFQNKKCRDKFARIRLKMCY